jgi:phage baseplate assembly protein W
MFTTFLNIPVNVKDIIRKAEAKRISAKNSIHNMIHMIVTTAYGEMRQNPSFGCDIWRFDFENIYNLNAFKEDMRKSLQNTIKTNEKRLMNVNIDLQIEQIDIMSKVKNKRIKTRISLVVNGVIEKTNESFTHQEVFFVGPLSYF